MVTDKGPNFLLHKVGQYLYVSKQVPIFSKEKKVKEYRHKHFGCIKNFFKTKTNEIKVFEPFIGVFELSREDLEKLKDFIDNNFKNISWKIPFSFIKNGITINAEVKSNKTKENILEEELITQ